MQAHTNLDLTNRQLEHWLPGVDRSRSPESNPYRPCPSRSSFSQAKHVGEAVSAVGSCRDAFENKNVPGNSAALGGSVGRRRGDVGMDSDLLYLNAFGPSFLGGEAKIQYIT